MREIRLKDKKFKTYLKEEEIQQQVKRIAVEIQHDVCDCSPLFVGILNGAFMFTAELMKQLDNGSEVQFARYSSYEGTHSTGKVRELMGVSGDVRGRVVILVEDIVETGLTLFSVKKHLLEQGAADVKIVTMLFKPNSLKCDLKPDYVGFEIPDDFVVGFGLDYDGLGRAYRDIYILAE